MAKQNLNFGYLATAGVIPKKDAHSAKQMKLNTSAEVKTTKPARIWERKLAASFRNLEKNQKTLDNFEGRLLEGLELASEVKARREEDGGRQDEMPKGRDGRSKAEVFADAENSLERISTGLRQARQGVKRAMENAVLPEDEHAASVARELLAELEMKARFLAARIVELKREHAMDNV